MFPVTFQPDETPSASAKKTLEVHSRLSPAGLSGDTFYVWYSSRGMWFAAFKDTSHQGCLPQKSSQKCSWDYQVFEKLFLNFIFYLSGMAWDIEGDNKLYSSRLQCWYESAKCLIQKMINSNSQDAIYKPEWGAESTIAWRNTGITDELSWLGSSYRVQQLVPCWVRARVAHTHTHKPLSAPLSS